ncbi:Putative ribonuclease H protein At1g65750 [Linum grandiflorum]
MWLATHDRLLTNKERRRRHLTETGVCTRCNYPHEIVLHVLRDCPFAVTACDLSDNQMRWDSSLLPWITHHFKALRKILLFGDCLLVSLEDQKRIYFHIYLHHSRGPCSAYPSLG